MNRTRFNFYKNSTKLWKFKIFFLILKKTAQNWIYVKYSSKVLQSEILYVPQKASLKFGRNFGILKKNNIFQNIFPCLFVWTKSKLVRSKHSVFIQVFLFQAKFNAWNQCKQYGELFNPQNQCSKPVHWSQYKQSVQAIYSKILVSLQMFFFVSRQDSSTLFF